MKKNKNNISIEYHDNTNTIDEIIENNIGIYIDLIFHMTKIKYFIH